MASGFEGHGARADAPAGWRGEARAGGEGGAPADRLPTWAIAGAAVVLTFLAGNRGGMAPLAWIAPLALALSAARLRGWRGRLAFLGLCTAAMALQTLKMVTTPIPAAVALGFGAIMGSLAWLWLSAWDAVQRRVRAPLGALAFGAFSALADWVGFALSPAGHWGAAAASLADDLPLLQLASLGGLSLVGLVVAWPAGAAAMLLLRRQGERPWKTAALAVGVALAAHGWGTLRLQAADRGPTLRVAGVTVDFPEPLTSMEQLRGAEDLLFARSELAVRRGAELVVWNEVATLVEPGEEEALRARGVAFAREHGVDLVLAYGRVVSREPFRYENAYGWIAAGGVVLETYHKHFLPLGEPAVPGAGPLRVHERPWGRAGGALCYDYDRPALAREHARGGAGLVALPSSDWRGIDPQHTLMARVRAIEGGFSLVRPVRAATSMAFDPYGRVRASLSAWERNDRVMLATVPTSPVPTLYAAAGDWPAAVAAAVALWAVAAAYLPRRRPHRRAVLV